MRPGAWFVQILAEGLIIGLFVIACVFVRSPPIQLLCLVVVVYVLWLLFRNPRFFYRRLVQTFSWALLLPPLSALSVHMLGYSRTEVGGLVSIALDLGAGASPPLLATLVVVFIAADFGTSFIDGVRHRRRLSVKVQSAELFVEPDGRSDLKILLMVTAPAGLNATIGPVAEVRPSLWPHWIEARVYRQDDGVGVAAMRDGERLTILPETSISFYVKGDDSRLRKSLPRRARLRWPAFSFGAVRLVVEPDEASSKFPVSFQFKGPDPSAPPRLKRVATDPAGE